MPTPATSPPTAIDDLVPPPGPTWRPVALVAGLVVICAAVAVAWASGRIAPMVDRPQTQMWGGDDPVHLSLELTARHDLDLVAIWEPPPGLAVRSVRVADPHRIDGFDGAVVEDWPGEQLPVRLAAGETTRITASYDVVDCGRLEAGPLEVVVRRKLGPITLTRTRDVEPPRGFWSIMRELPVDEHSSANRPMYQQVAVGWAEGIAVAVCEPDSLAR